MRPSTIRHAIVIAGPMLALAAALLWAADPPREQKYQQAVDLFESKGDVKGAMKLFEEVAKSPDRNLAARSLLYLGSCYEKLGQIDAQKAYERIVRDFGDQPDVSAKARNRLSALGKTAGDSVVARRVWASSPSDDREYGGSAVSLDGRYLAFVDYANDGIGIRDALTGEERRVVERTSPLDSFEAALISPDGKSVAYSNHPRDGRDHLHVVDAGGSNSRLLAEAFPLSWSPDGTHLLAAIDDDSVPRNISLVSVAVADGSVRRITSGSNWARFSPDSRYIAFVRTGHDGTNGYGGIFLIPANGGPEVPVVDGRNRGVVWAPDGKRLLFVSDRRGTNDLWSIRITDGKPDGPPQLLKEYIDWPLGITRDGDLYYEVWRQLSDIFALEVDSETGKLTSRPKRITTRYINFAPAWSPDGESLAYYSQRGPAKWGEGALTMVVRSMQTGEERTVPLRRPLSFGHYRPYWFPDGHSLFTRLFGSIGELVRIDLQTGEDRRVLSDAALSPTGGIYVATTALAPDGRSVYYLSRDDKAHQSRVLVRSLDGGGDMELCRISGDYVSGPAVSPDNSRLAFTVLSEAGDWRIFTVSAAGGEAKELYHPPDFRVMPLQYRSSPVWSRNGQRLFFVTGIPRGKPGGEIWSISAGAPSGPGEPQPLGIGLNNPTTLDLHPDGKQLVFTNVEDRDEIWVLKNLLKPSR